MIRPTAIALAILTLSSAAQAEDPAPAEEPRPLPDFMRNKRRMTASGVADKREGGYFTGLPLINSDPDTGIGFGARVLHFDNGPRDDVMFEATPYRHRAYAQAFFTTKGYQYHTLDFDAPYVSGSAFRLRASLIFEKNTAANYFGLGEKSLDRLSFPGTSERYASQSDYEDALRQIGPDGKAFTRFNQYILTRPAASVTLERDFFGGLVRAVAGLKLAYADVRQWTGETVTASDAASGRTGIDAVQAPTLLERECARGVVVGCGGGLDGTLKLGVAYDTRDFEPDPNSGVFIELTSELAGKFSLSEYDWARITLSPRVYYSPFPKLADVVVAGRLLGSVQSAGTPFFEMNQLSFADYDRPGLGGLRTLRGFKQDRFVGSVVALATLEVRWTFYEFNIRQQHFWADARAIPRRRPRVRLGLRRCASSFPQRAGRRISHRLEPGDHHRHRLRRESRRLIAVRELQPSLLSTALLARSRLRERDGDRRLRRRALANDELDVHGAAHGDAHAVRLHVTHHEVDDAAERGVRRAGERLHRDVESIPGGRARRLDVGGSLRQRVAAVPAHLERRVLVDARALGGLPRDPNGRGRARPDRDLRKLDARRLRLARRRR